MSAGQRIAAGVIAIIVVIILVWGGVGFFGGSHYDTHVSIAKSPPQTVPPPPTTTSTEPKKPPNQHPTQPCSSKQTEPVYYFGNDPKAAQFHDFGTPLVEGLSPLFEPRSTPQPDTSSVVTASWSRLCRDPALARAVVAAAYPTWSGLHINFNWHAALELLNQGKWSSASMVYHDVAPAPWTMMMVASPTGGQPRTLIVHAPYQGWYLAVRFGNHVVQLRVGCGDQPVLNMYGYQAPLFTLFPRA